MDGGFSCCDTQAPLNQPALKDKMLLLTEKGSIPLPHPPQTSNKGNYIVSLNNFVRWLGEQAEELGAEVYPGIAASEVLSVNCVTKFLLLIYSIGPV